MSDCDCDVLIVGAGPAGLAAAIAAKREGLSALIVDKGGLVDGIYRFPRNMVFFTTPELLEIGGLPFVTPFEKPTRMEALRYYRRVADTFELAMAFDEEVVGDSARQRKARRALFELDVKTRGGGTRIRCARAVVLATGYYDQPNLLGVPGEDLPHVSHYYSEPHPYYRRPVVVVGGKNSAAEAALDLYRAGARVTLVHRERGPGRLDQVLGEAGHREPDRGRVHSGAVRHERASASRRRRCTWRAPRARPNSRPTACSC